MTTTETMMAEHFANNSPPIDPKTRALEAYIETSVDHLLGGHPDDHRDGLLFLSTWHEAMPAMVHLDPVLQAIDVRVFAVLWIWGRQQGRSSMAFPTYAYLMTTCQIQSRATLSRCLAILRITRWITLCRRVRDGSGRFRGNIYALHDEPLALAGTNHLDPQYMTFLHQSAEHHHHPRVRKVAWAMRNSLSEHIDEGRDVLAESALSSCERRLEAINTVCDRSDSGHFFGFHKNAMAQLKRRHRQVQQLNTETEQDQVQKLNLDQVRLSNGKKSNLAVCSSSKKNSYKKTTTTTDHVKKFERELSTGSGSKQLIYSETLTPNERQLAQMHVQRLPAALQQPMLDELHGQIQSRRHSHKPISNPIGFLCWLCNEARAERIHLTSRGTRVKEARERERQLAEYDAAKTSALTEQAIQALGEKKQMTGVARGNSNFPDLDGTRGVAPGNSKHPKLEE